MLRGRGCTRSPNRGRRRGRPKGSKTKKFVVVTENLSEVEIDNGLATDNEKSSERIQT